MSDIKVLIVDDHKIIRDMLELGFKQTKGITVVGVSSNANKALQQIDSLHPDVILLDLNLPDMSGLEVTKRVTQKYSDIKVIIITYETGAEKTRFLLRAGARGYISKEEGFDRFVYAVKAVHHGQHYITPQLAEKLVFTGIEREGDTPFDNLTDRELEIMLMVLKGKTIQEISEQLKLNPKTVNAHRCNLNKKVNVKNSIELMIKAIKYGIIEVD